MKSPRATSERVMIDTLEVGVYVIPTEAPEADGTLEWDKTTMICVHAHAGGQRGFGYTYGHPAAGVVIGQTLASIVEGSDAMEPEETWHAMRRALRNAGRPGIGMTAVSAVDAALWDLKARILDVPLVTLLGQVRESIAGYGSGGFVSMSDDDLLDSATAWAERGVPAMKIKIGRSDTDDRRRLRLLRNALPDDFDLFVDANGAYGTHHALTMAEFLAEQRVKWFEEPVTSQDLVGMREIRNATPSWLRVTTGEYAWEPRDVERILDAEAVDALEVDASRCGGVTGFMRIGRFAGEKGVALTSHCCPSLHLHLCCALESAEMMELFHDHVRIERMLLEGAGEARDGCLTPDSSRHGNGLELRTRDAERFRA